jgi:hypothetical protein
MRVCVCVSDEVGGIYSKYEGLDWVALGRFGKLVGRRNWVN